MASRSSKGFALIALLPYAIGVLAVAGLAGWLWWSAQHWCNQACEEATERAVAAEGLLQEAQERATALALLWSEAINKVEKVYVERVVYRERQFAAIRERAGAIDYSGGITLSADAVGVLRDSASAANDSAAAGEDKEPAAPVPESPRDTTAEEWVAFAISAAEAYADAREKWASCVQAYEALDDRTD